MSTASITVLRDYLDRMEAQVARADEAAAHNIEFAPLRHIMCKMQATLAGLQQALTANEAGHALDGAEAVIKRCRPVGFPATHPLALRRAAYVSALVHAMSSGRFDDLRREQELIDPDRALWRQYAPDEPVAHRHTSGVLSIARRHGKLFSKLVANSEAKRSAA